MKHRPVVVELKIVTHLPSLPYRDALDRFVHHTHDCEPCSLAADDDESTCADYCRPEGHDLYHRISKAVDEQHATSIWN